MIWPATIPHASLSQSSGFQPNSWIIGAIVMPVSVTRPVTITCAPCLSASTTGHAPKYAFALAAYDALHVAALAFAQVGLGSITDYRAEVLRQAAAYDGATGNTELNANGDRAVGDYDFYQVCGGGTPAWKRVSAFRTATEAVETIDGC